MIEIKDAGKFEFKQKFIDRYSKLTDFEEFKKYSLSYARRSIRVNTLKISVEELRKRIEGEWTLDPIPWCKEGFWIEHKGIGEEKRRDVGNLIEHSLGYIYIQESVSMIPPVVLNPMPGDVVIDMAASPGSKTTQICAMMNNEGIVIANDITGDRLKPLGLNLQRCGITNSIVTLMRAQKIRGLEFDKILLDAPCSGTGTIRKSLKTILIWNPTMVSRLASTQKQLIENAFTMLKKGGEMVYSTCSVEPEENEGVISFLLEKFDNAKIEEIHLNIKRSKPFLEFEGDVYNREVSKCLRIWPQDNDTEGFFVAKIKKE